MSQTAASRAHALPSETFDAVPNGSILGVNYSGHHDSAIAIVAPDGTPVFACALERISRVKQDGRPPDLLLEHLPWNKIAAIAVSTNGAPTPPDHPQSRFHPVELGELRADTIPHAPPFYAFFNRLPLEKRFYCHQESHAASAYLISGFDDALCFTYDGGMHNCPWFGGLYRGTRGNRLEPIDRFSNARYAKISSLYLVMTALLGFTPLRHEGKITGLAAFGTVRPEITEQLERLFTVDYGQMESLVEWRLVYSADVPPYLRVTPTTYEMLSARFQRFTREDIAATLQAFTEDHIITILTTARGAGVTSENICLAGGLFANVKLNQRVRDFGFKHVFVAPPMTDDGTALGAALLLAAERGKLKSDRAPSMYLGPAYTPAAVRAALEANGVVADAVGDVGTAIAADLAAGRVVAYFSGAMEYGPRALGHRSILSQATDAKINNELNARLRRTEFMPFAPIVRAEDAAALFGDVAAIDRAAQFMTITVDCTQRARDEAPAVVHVDGTARPQIVDAASEPLLHAILTAYREATGLSAVINTSFNVHEEPIVCSPEDALAGFFDSGLDRLYFDCGLCVRLEANALAGYTSLRTRAGATSPRELQLTAELRIRDTAAREATFFALALEWTRSENNLEAARALVRRYEASAEELTKRGGAQAALAEAEQTLLALTLQWTRSENELEAARALVRRYEASAAEFTKHGGAPAALAGAEQTLLALTLQWTRSENELESRNALLRRGEQAAANTSSALAQSEHERDRARTLATAAIADLEMLRGLVEFESGRAERLRETFLTTFAGRKN